MRLILKWVINAISLLIVAYFVPGFVVRGFAAALIAALVIGLVNSTLGLLLKIITFPLSIVTFGIFLIIINAAMLKVAAAITPGFFVRDWTAAIIGAVLLTIVSWLLHWLIGDEHRERYAR